MIDSIRTRLTLWSGGVLALALILFSAGVYLLLARDLRQRMDENLRASTETIATSLIQERTEGEGEAEAAHSVVDELHLYRQSIAIYDSNGRLIAENPAQNNNRSPLAPPDTSPSGDITFYNAIGAQRVAARRVEILPANAHYIILVSQPLDTVTEELATLKRVFLVAIPLAILLAGLGGFFLARKSLVPVTAMTDQAREISAENLKRRLPIANPRDELGQLASTFNELLARLDESFDMQRQFMADASHELRTPLSVIRATSQVILEKPERDENEYRNALMMIDDQARRLARIVDDMFTLARADTGRRPLDCDAFYLDELILETARAAKALASRKGVNVEATKSIETQYYGDEHLLRQMLLNLLDNAVRHTPTGGDVRVSLNQNESICEVVIADTGYGIPLEAQPHVFERFYRADKSRSRLDINGANQEQKVGIKIDSSVAANGNGANGGGAGLGLSIARWIAEAHGGTINLVRSNPAGTVFSISLPLRQT